MYRLLRVCVAAATVKSQQLILFLSEATCPGALLAHVKTRRKQRRDRFTAAVAVVTVRQRCKERLTGEEVAEQTELDKQLPW